MPGPLSPEEDAERRRLHALRLSDAEIAAKRGTSRGAIHAWRTKNDLPTNFPRAPPGEVLLLTLALWHEGFTDKEIESVIGHIPTQERKRLGLPPNKKCRTCDVPIPPQHQFCDAHLAPASRGAEGATRYYIARAVLWNLTECIGDDYHHARDLAIAEFPWLSESIERWEADGRVGPVPKHKTSALRRTP